MYILQQQSSVTSNGVYLNDSEYVRDLFGPSYKPQMYNPVMSPINLQKNALILMPVDLLQISKSVQRKEVSKKKIQGMIGRGLSQDDSYDGYSPTLFECVKVCYEQGNWFIIDGQQRTAVIKQVKFPKLRTSNGDRKFVLCRFEGALPKPKQAKRFIDLNLCRNNVAAADIRKVNKVISPNSSQTLIDLIAPQYGWSLVNTTRSIVPKALTCGLYLNEVVTDMQTLHQTTGQASKMVHSFFEILQAMYEKTNTKVNGNIVKGLGNFMVHSAKRKMNGDPNVSRYSEDILLLCVTDMIAQDFEQFESMSRKIANGPHIFLGARKMLEMTYNGYVNKPQLQISLYQANGKEAA